MIRAFFCGLAVASGLDTIGDEWGDSVSVMVGTALAIIGWGGMAVMVWAREQER